MAKTLKVSVVGLVFTFVLGLTVGFMSFAEGTEVTRTIVEGEESNQLKVTGVVTHNNLETGFYEVGGYRLVGDTDFSQYENKMVVVLGELDTSPSIYMTKAIKVESIEVLTPMGDINKKEQLEKQLANTEEQIKSILENMPEYIEQYGEDSSEVRHYKEELDILYKDQVNLRLELYKIKEANGEYPTPMELEGMVTHNTLEGGFYEVEGYRLAGDFDFSQYAGKVVRVTGEPDNSPSIYMTKAIKVESIEAVNVEDEKNNLALQIKMSIVAIEDINKNMSSYIKQYGKDSSEVRHYVEELEILQNDVIHMLEQLVALDGRNADLGKYKELGRFLEKKNKGKGAISIYVNGEKLKFSVSPIIKKGNTLVPFRAIAESLGADVSWDGKNHKVTMKKGGKEIVFLIKDKKSYVNGKSVKLSVPAEIISGSTMIPLRFVSESLDTKVTWLPEGSVIVINEPVDK